MLSYIQFEKDFPKLLSNEEIREDRIRLLKESGELIRERREKIGISRYDLSRITKISPFVLEAIENAWIDKLPEKAYLFSMITIIEKQLNITDSKFSELISKDPNNKKDRDSNNMFASIELFDSWKGNLLYLVIILTSITFLNYINRHSILIEGISIEKDQLGSSQIKDNEISNFIYKNLNKNIEENDIKNSFLNFKNIFNIRESEWLEIKLNTTSDISIISKDLKLLEINDSKGLIKFRLKQPITIISSPPLTEKDHITWKGEKYIPSKNNNGIYKF